MIALFASGHHRLIVDILGLVWFESGVLLYFAINGLALHYIW